MGKRSNYERKPRDYYPTPYDAAFPLFKFLKNTKPAREGRRLKFIEPMAGDGRLARHIESDGHECVYMCDLEPQAEGIEQRDVLFFDKTLPECDFIITNPPWKREVLHPSIERFAAHADTWLLFDADWMHTLQASPFKDLCKEIISVGRVSWEDNGIDGMDNCAWYLFSHDHDWYGKETIFNFRQKT